MIVILDFGSQYTHLISRRIRSLGVYTEVVPFNVSSEKVSELNPSGIILSGGPQSVYSDESLRPDLQLFRIPIPILGICYGSQLVAHIFGGRVRKADVGEYGRTKLRVLKKNKILSGIPSKEFFVWMSHGDVIESLPEGFEVLAHTDFSPNAVFKFRNIWGVQFHPEVYHTQFGDKIIENFVFGICRAKKDWNIESFLESKLKELSEIKGGVLCAVSGGTDSTVLAVLLSKVKNMNVKYFLIDTGLMRKNDAEKIRKNFRSLGMQIDVFDASSDFLSRLKGVEDPEEKRKIVGRVFAEVFGRIINSYKGMEYLAQGTLYPDVIESGVSVSGKADVIKTHHNVGGMPSDVNFKIIEPFRYLYKDEVREIGKILSIPEEIMNRHPFPGPGLSVRIIGEVTEEKLRILREAEEIFEEELMRAGLYYKVWQAFCVLTNSKSVGVVGDRRRYGWVLALRVVESVDAMTADWAHLNYTFLDTVARKIIASVPQISRVVYDITSKPPATIEWE